MNSKKGVGVGQVFIFIIAAITFALIMIFGYKAISGFLQSGEEVAFVQFKTDLESSVKKIYTEYGAVRMREYNTPLKYERICFVNMDALYDPECDFDPYACDVWQDAEEGRLEEGNLVKGHAAVDENVFLQPQAPVKIKVHKIDIGEGYLCEDIVRGSFSLRLEGRGDKTALSKIE